jgi:hypothetical protein
MKHIALLTLLALTLESQAQLYDGQTEITRQQALSRLPSITNKNAWPLERIAQETGLLVIQPFAPPEGYLRNGNRRIELIDGQAREVFDVISVADYEAQQAATEAARIAALASSPQIQAALTVLDTLLQVVGLSIPVSEADTAAHILGLMAAGQLSPDSGIAGNIQGAWGIVQGFMSKDDVEAVWNAIKEEQQ